MHLHNSVRRHHSLKLFSKKSINRNLHRKIVCLVLVLSLFLFPLPGLVDEFAVIASTATKSLSFSLRHVSIFFGLQTPPEFAASQKETLAGRLYNVSRLRITPLKYVGYEGQSLQFNALPLNFEDEIIQGVKITWESSNPDKVEIDDAGRARFLQPGLARITCRAGSAEASAPLLVHPGKRPEQSDADWRTDQARLGIDGNIKTGQAGSSATETLASLVNALAPTAHAQSGGSYWPDTAYDELWSESRNLTGNPKGSAIESTRMGTVMPEGSNFNFSIPIIGLGGRGLSASLKLDYNSRVWSRRSNTVTYDPIKTWPSPGFSLGFGRIATYNSQGAIRYILIDADGTRRYLGQATSGQAATLKTTDGSNLTYVTSGTLFYNDGTKISYGYYNNRLLPMQITDPNGNYISISYKDITCDPGCADPCSCPIIWPPLTVDFVTDSLGRIIKFNYDEGNPASDLRLVSISAPGFGGTSQNPVTETLVQFEYETRLISTNFSGLTVDPVRINNNGKFLRRVRFPATSTGYVFNYSDYGVIYNYSQRTGMNDSLGNPTDGVESASVSFNYPVSASTPLTDVPAFSQRTESATNSPTSTYTYSSDTDTIAQTKTFKVTNPDSTQLWMTRSTDAASIANGLVVQLETKKNSITYSKSVIGYTTDPGGSKQVQSVTAYDEAGQPSKTDVEYDQYGNISNKRDYGFQENLTWVVRRRNHYIYKTDTAYVNAYLRNLITVQEVLDARANTNNADDEVVSKTAYAYDDYSVMGGMESYSGTAHPPGHLASYNTSYLIRGNVTGVTQWSDIAANTSSTRNRKYDVFGNLVKEQVSCCQERTYTCTESSCWGQPEQVISGAPSSVHLTTTIDTDFNTDLVKSKTNNYNRTVNFTYDAAKRPTGVTTSTTAAKTLSYNDQQRTAATSISYQEGTDPQGNPVIKTISSSQSFDGWGRPTSHVNPNGGQVNMAYDAMGRMISRTNPFSPGAQSISTTTYEYDELGRQKRVNYPDGNATQLTYNGKIVTGTDTVNRKSQREVDGLGRMVKVTEQDASGNLTQETSYAYNTLGALVEVNQGSQIRKFKYDALGRLLYEKIPEKNATINDGTGQFWSSKYTYTEFGDINTRLDARGVVATYTYDELHRLTDISYNTSNASGVVSTPGVTYTYDRVMASPTNNLLLSVSVGSGYKESYSYDTQQRVNIVTQRIDGRDYPINYAYNDVDQIKQVDSTNLSYDNLGRLLGVGNAVSEISYNVAGQITGDRILDGLVEETFTYDSGRMQPTGQTANIVGGGQLLNLTYGYQAQAGQMGSGTLAGNAGQLVSVSGTINGQTEAAAYTYDNTARLSTSNQTTNGQNFQRRFSYDRWGNRTSMWNATTGGTLIQTTSYQQSGGAPTNQIQNLSNIGSTVSYTYDAEGNVVNDGSYTYQYDAENRLVSVNNGSTATYSYDHRNRRVKKLTGTSGTHFLWNGSQVLREQDAATGATTVSYIYAGNRLIAKSPVGLNSTPEFFLSDRLSIRLSLKKVAVGIVQVTGQQAHLPFGEEIAPSGAQDKHHFTSYERDSETNTDYALSRQYANGIGRFNRPDPYSGSSKLKSPQTLNRYAYAVNDPINNKDPLGLDIIEIITRVIADGYDCRPINSGLISTGNDRWDCDAEQIVQSIAVSLTEPQQPQPALPQVCDAPIPTDQNELEALYVVLGEATELSRLFRNRYNDGDRRGNPTDSIRIDIFEFYDEAMAFVSVIRNRAERRGQSWAQIVSPAQFLGYNVGIRKLAQYRVSLAVSVECAQLWNAVTAIATVKAGGGPRNFFWWVGIKATNPVRTRRPGDVRYADTDFFEIHAVYGAY